MRILTAIIFLSFSLGGCATYAPSVPDGYSGPLASVKDSVRRHSSSKADFFYLEKIDGKGIENSLFKTREANYGGGFYMAPVVLDHKIPARECIVSIVGRTEYAAPILALTNPVYEVAGEVTFTPEPDKAYVVKGELGKDYSAVWIEEKGSKRVVGDKIELKGDGALGLFEK